MELFEYMKACQAAVAHVARCRHHTVTTRHLQAHLGTSLTLNFVLVSPFIAQPIIPPNRPPNPWRQDCGVAAD
jgi:hypothetical protein